MSLIERNWCFLKYIQLDAALSREKKILTIKEKVRAAEQNVKLSLLLWRKLMKIEQITKGIMKINYHEKNQSYLKHLNLNSPLPFLKIN